MNRRHDTRPAPLDERVKALGPADLARLVEAFSRAVGRDEAVDVNACVRCGLCAEACHYTLADPTPGTLPAYKVELVGSAYRRSATFLGKYLPAVVGARDIDTSLVEAWIDECFGRCTMCGRCSLHCTVGLDIPALVRAARRALAECDLVPAGLDSTLAAAVETGNNMAIPRDEWVATVAWLEEELQAETGDPGARLPLDVEGAELLYAINPREAKFFPMSLVAAGAIFHAAGASWTLSSDHYDVTNYGLFAGHPEKAGELSRRLFDEARRLGVKTLVLGECGHGFLAHRWLAPEWLGDRPDVEVCSVLEVIAGYLRDGRLVLDPSQTKTRLTLHDPCNLVRLGGLADVPREILSSAASDWVEMTPNREQNFCCGGGGGQLSMTRYAKRRLEAGRVKAEQIRATGAAVVVAPCHNCIDQLTELSREYRLGVGVRTVCEIVAGAIARPAGSADTTAARAAIA
jgi:Fe-S oxidoreductase